MSSPKPYDVDFLLSQTGWVPAITQHLVRDSNLADDVVQSTWAIALEHAPDTKNPRRLHAWLFVVARNLARRMHQREAGRRQSELHAAKPEAEEEVEHDIDRVHRHKLLAEAVLALPEPYRSAISLRFFSELDYAEIAQRQGVRAGTARQRVSRGLSLLRERLDRQFDGDRRAWCIALGALPRATTSSEIVPRSRGMTAPARTALLAGLAGTLAVGAWLAFGSPGDRTSADSVVGRVTTEPAAAPLDRSNTSESTQRQTIANDLALDRGGAVALERAANEPEQSLHGIVVDMDGRPLPNALIVVRRDDRRAYPIPDTKAAVQLTDIAHGSTGSDGAFSFAIPAGLPHDLFVTHAAGLAAIVSNRYAGERVVVQAAPHATLRGRVYRSEGGEGVADARVRGWTNDEALHPLFEGVTASDGSFEFSGLASGVVGIEVLPRDDTVQSWIQAVLNGGEITILDVPAMRGAKLTGRVVDEETGVPIAGALVGVGQRYSRATTTDDDGRFELRGLDPSGYREVHARADGFAESTRLPEPFTSESGKLDFVLARERIVTGRVLSPSGSPLAGAYVAVVGRLRSADGASIADSRSTISDDDGRFRVGGLRRGVRHSLFVRSRGFGSVAYELARGDTDERSIEVPDVVLVPGFILAGEVVDDFGRPLVNCSVGLRGVQGDYTRFASAPGGPAGEGHVDSRRGRTDDRGHFAFADVAFGTYRIIAGQSGVTSEVTVTLDERTSAAGIRPRITVTTGFRIGGRVIDFTGKPVLGATVHVLDPSGSAARTARSASDGSFHVLGLGPGPYVVEIEPERWNGPREARETCFARIEDVRGGDPDLAITLPRGVPIMGRIEDAAGAPVAYRWVEALLGDGTRVDRVFTRGDGSFVLVVDALAVVDIQVDGRRIASSPIICARKVSAGASSLALVIPE